MGAQRLALFIRLERRGQRSRLPKQTSVLTVAIIINTGVVFALFYPALGLEGGAQQPPVHEATAPAVRDTTVTWPHSFMGHGAGHGLGSNSPSWGQGSQHPSVRGHGVRVVPLAIPGVSDEADFPKEGGTVPKRCSCPKYLTRQMKEKLSSSIYCRHDVAIARTVLGSCSTRLLSPRSSSLTPGLGAGFTEVAGIKAPRLRVTPPGCIPLSWTRLGYVRVNVTLRAAGSHRTR